jgi:hypothetical protein
MASKKKKRKSLFKKTGDYIFNITVLLLILWFGLPLGLIVHGFYKELFNLSPHKTRSVPQEVRRYYAFYQGKTSIYESK